MNRIKEPSTWAGVAGFAALLSQMFPQYAWIGHVVAGVSSAAAMGLQERSGAAAPIAVDQVK